MVILTSMVPVFRRTSGRFPSRTRRQGFVLGSLCLEVWNRSLASKRREECLCLLLITNRNRKCKEKNYSDITFDKQRGIKCMWFIGNNVNPITFRMRAIQTSISHTHAFSRHPLCLCVPIRVCLCVYVIVILCMCFPMSEIYICLCTYLHAFK